MLHLTMTGYYAGQTYCGAAKGIEGIEGHTYEHAAYSKEGEARQRAMMCPACRAIVDEIDADDTPAPVDSLQAWIDEGRNA